MLYLLYHNFAREVESSSVKKDVKNFRRLDPILTYTREHYNEPISLSQIANIACFQEEYFCHFFKKNMGVTYFQYLNEIRLSHIYHDLTSTDIPLKELLERHGFTNYKLFRRMFYEQFHTTPGEYRKSYTTSDLETD
jgi:AraC-like DNA-binding protein